MLFFILVVQLVFSSHIHSQTISDDHQKWLVSHVAIRASSMGKDRYRQHYLLEPGDTFDSKIHRLGMENLQQVLAAEGYFNATVADTISYDQQQATTSIMLHIHHKKQFVIREVSLNLLAEDGVVPSDQDLAKQLKKLSRDLFLHAGYSKELLDRGAKQLHEFLIKQGYFASTIALEEEINRGQSGVRLLFTMTLHQKSIFAFVGNHFFSNDEFLEQIRLFSASVTMIPPALIAQEFLELYKKEGFWHAEIDWHDSGEQMLFTIHEGPRIRISKVKINGCTAFLESDLFKQFFKPLIARPFRQEVVEEQLTALGTSYLQSGFWDFAVVATDYQPICDDQYELILTINEGKRRYLKAVRVEDDCGIKLDRCMTRYRELAQPIPFDIQIIQEQKRSLTKSLHASGRLYARPHPELQEEADGTRLVWKFIGSTDVVSFGQTQITGNSRLPARVIERELQYRVGDQWDQHKIEKTVSRLKKMGIFDSVTLAPEDIALPGLSKSLVLKYVEDYPYEVRARLGIQGVNRNIVQFNAQGISYKAGGSFLAKNPFNIGDVVRFDLDFSRYMYDMVASYKFPWLWHWPIRTELKGYSSHYDQPFVIGSPKVLYKAIQDGFLFGFSQDYYFFDADLNIGCEWLEIKPGDGYGDKKEQLSRALFLNPRLIDHTYPYVFIQPIFFSSSLDNKIQPKRGALSLISCKAMLAPTFSSAAFFKILLEQSFFIPVGPLVFAWRARAGTIFNTHFQNINPIERFYLGGAYSVRSYEPDLAPPLNPFRDGQGCWHVVATGGRSMFNMNSEVRFPLYGSLSGVVFNDMGVLSDHCIRAAFKEHTLVGALGFGLRINTVVGPLRFDIGWKLNRQQFPQGLKRERPYAWFLALGNAF